MSFGTFAAVTSALDWLLNASVRNPPFTEQERYICERYLERPHRVLPPPDMSLPGIAYLLALMAGVFFLGFTICRFIESAKADLRQSAPLYLKLVRITALLAATGAMGFFCYTDFMLPAVMRLYFAASFGIAVYLWLELILGLPYRLLRQRG